VKFSINTPPFDSIPGLGRGLLLRVPPHGFARGASLILRGLLQLLKAAGAIHAGGSRKIRFRRDQQGGLRFAGVKMLEDDAVGFDWKPEQIALFPMVALIVDKRVFGTLDRNENHAALAAKGEIGRSPNFRTRKPESCGSNRSLWNWKG